MINLPNPHFERKQEITQDERDSLIHFNTVKFWHCYYNPETEVLYNEFCIRIMDNATDYLINTGLMSSDKKQIKYFEDEQ